MHELLLYICQTVLIIIIIFTRVLRKSRFRRTVIIIVNLTILYAYYFFIYYFSRANRGNHHVIVRFRVAYIIIQQYHSFEVSDFIFNFDVQYSTIYVAYANPDWILLQVSQTNIFTRRIILCVNITSENIMIIATRFFPRHVLPMVQ